MEILFHLIKFLKQCLLFTFLLLFLYLFFSHICVCCCSGAINISWDFIHIYEADLFFTVFHICFIIVSPSSYFKKIIFHLLRDTFYYLLNYMGWSTSCYSSSFFKITEPFTWSFEVSGTYRLNIFNNFIVSYCNFVFSFWLYILINFFFDIRELTFSKSLLFFFSSTITSQISLSVL